MKISNVLILFALGGLAGCAGLGQSPTAADGLAPDAGFLKLMHPAAALAEVSLDGKRYVGEWHERRCFTTECRGVFWNIGKVQRKHVRRGDTTLMADDASRLACSWVRYREKVVGRCEDPDGRVFRLTGV
ncbi:MAG: hypothetical protein AB1593_04410 [Pseudomonadota bacterium]